MVLRTWEQLPDLHRLPSWWTKGCVVKGCERHDGSFSEIKAPSVSKQEDTGHDSRKVVSQRIGSITCGVKIAEVFAPDFELPRCLLHSLEYTLTIRPKPARNSPFVGPAKPPEP